MDTACLDYQLSDEERTQFEEQGYLILPEVLSPEEVEHLTEVTDRLDGERRARENASPGDRLNAFDFLGFETIPRALPILSNGRPLSRWR